MIKEEIDKPQEAGSVSSGYVVGIGASAGGLEAINEFFDNMPQDTGFSFIIIQHLSPDYKSLMGELLTKHTNMKVYEAEQGMVLRPNSIYLLPPKKVLTIKGDQLILQDKQRDNHPNTTIDLFFESLAEEKKEKAIGVILSGTGTDGTRGIAAMKKNGGIVLVQDPITAEFDGMPNSAIAAGHADLILSPDMMPEELIEFLQDAPLIQSFNALNQQEENLIIDILELVAKVTNHDFSHYKRPTLKRRLAKRMSEKNIRSLRDYYLYLTKDNDEVKSLCQEFLINVTRFFRDEEAFESIKTRVLPNLLAGRASTDTLKLWVVGCSSGEEAYSLAILCEEFLESHRLGDVSIKIFATDIDQQALDIGSKGLFNEQDMKAVSPERQKRFFIKEGDYYRVSPTLRKMVVFAKHDITKDPPFSQIDLISCRNMLIYMSAPLQNSVLQKFHFSVKENGFLFLGPSENTNTIKDALDEIDKKWKIFQVVSKARTGDYESYLQPASKSFIAPTSPLVSKKKNALNFLPEIFKDTILEEFGYAGIFVNKDLEIKQAIGNFKDYIRFPDGQLNFNLLKLVSPDLSLALSTCIRKAIKDNEVVVQKKIKVREGKSQRIINIIVKPYLVQKTYIQPFLFIVLNEDEVGSIKKTNFKSPGRAGTSQRLAELEEELQDTKANLQSLIEELESANEELQSSNEEIISANEELQSTNEELQSLNEELHTVNTEHQLKIRELIELNDDLNNYFNNTDIGQLLIDRHLVIRKFTPVVTRQVNLREQDIGRSIADISTNIRNTDLVEDLKLVMENGESISKEVVMANGDIFVMRISPYMRQNKKIDGVVVNFIDITENTKLTRLVEAILNSTTNGILAKTSIRNEEGEIVDFKYVLVNSSAEAMLGFEDGYLTNRQMLETNNNMERLFFENYVEVVEKGHNYQFEFFHPEMNRWFDIICVKMMDGLVTTISNITEKKRAADMLRQGYENLKVTTSKLESSNLELEKSNFALLQFASVASHDLKEPLRKIQAYGNILKDKVKSKLEGKENTYLDKVINSAERMQVLVDDILSLSKLSNISILKEPVELETIVHRIIDDLEINIQEKKAEVEVTDLPKIAAVPAQMHQLFQNLVNNALKFTSNGSPRIRIYEKPVPDQVKQDYKLEGDHVCIVVEDNGIGFEPRFAEKIFGIFQRLNGANYQGTGIGLAICKKIVDNHNGIIYAESNPGEGAKFHVVLPRK